MQKIAVAFFLVTAMNSNASAFGMNDLLSIGIQAGSKLVGAAVDAGIDKARDAMRDPEAEAAKQREEERRIAEQFQRQVAEIEATPNLRPIDRERLIITIEKLYAQAAQFQAFVEIAESRQRQERDKIFTTAGLIHVVGEAAMGAPSVTMARAELLSATGEIQTNEALARLRVAAGGDSLQSQGVVNAAATGILAHQTRDQVTTGLAGARETALNSHSTEIATAVNQAKAAAMPSPVAERPRLDAFSPDLGRKVFIEFVGSPAESDFLRRAMAASGHLLTDRADDADVVYRIEGEYSIAETKGREGLTRDVGSLLEYPTQDITPAERSKRGSLTAGLGRLLMGMVEMPNVPQHDDVSKQTVLLVAARQPIDGKETRAAVTHVDQGGPIAGAVLSATTRDALYAKLGLVSGQKGASLAATRP
jgi:hypothetical protein